MPGELVNLLVDLRDDRLSRDALERAVAEVRAAGIGLEEIENVGERLLSWIDLEFDGRWSGDVAAGSAWFAFRGEEPVGFAGFGAKGLRYAWLRAWEAERDVGVFGPAGVVAKLSGSPAGHTLRLLALGSLRDRGFAHALIPEVADELTVSYYQNIVGGRVVDRFPAERGEPPLRTTVLASGGGTNFQAVIDAAAAGLPLDVRALVANRAGAFALERARKAGIPSHVHAWDRAALQREAYDARLTEIVAATEPELLLLLGWMHVLPQSFLARFERTVNIHPAFLPYDGTAETVTMPDGAVIRAFRGAHAIRDALAAASPWYGATAHRVSVDFDRGAILQRAPLRLREKEEAAALAALRPTEHRVLFGAIRRVLSER